MSLPVSRGLELDVLKGPIQPKPFYESLMLRWGSAQPWVMVRLWLRAGFRLLRGSVSRCCDSDQVKLRYLGVLSNEDYCLSEVGVLGKERGSH